MILKTVITQRIKFKSDDLDYLDNELFDEIDLTYKDKRRTHDRANKLSKARLAAGGLSHLKNT